MAISLARADVTAATTTAFMPTLGDPLEEGVARRADPRLGMFYLLTWVCVEVATAKTFLNERFLEEAVAHGWLRAAFSVMPAGMVVLGIFLVSAVASSRLAARTMRLP